MLWHVWSAFTNGIIDADYARPRFHFTWYWFQWVRPLPGQGMHLVFGTIGLAAAAMVLGLCYRLAAFVLCLLFTYKFLIDQACYLNHFYLTCLLALLMAFIPAHHALSVDAWIRPGIRSQTVPRWALWILRFQVAVPYFYSGISKLAPDWLQGQPMTNALKLRQDRLGLLAPYAGEPWLIWVFNYGSLVFDLLIVPLLVWRKTRLPAFLVVCVFHTTNHFVFDIDFFPWFMMVATTVFFEPDWPRRFLNTFTEKKVIERTSPQSLMAKRSSPCSWASLSTLRRGGVIVLGTYVLLQAVIPLRHHCYEGSSSWTEEGHQFAWNLMLRSKRCAVQFYATDKETGRTTRVELSHLLTRRQRLMLGKYPRMLHQLAHFFRDEMREQNRDVEIRVIDIVSLNSRKPQLLVDPRVDLAAEPLSWREPSFLMELHEPLRKDSWSWPVSEWSTQVDISPYLRGTPMDPHASGR